MPEAVRRLLGDPNGRRELLAALPPLEDWPWTHRSLLAEDLLLREGPWALDLLERARADDEWLVRLLRRLEHAEAVAGVPEGLGVLERAGVLEPATALEHLELFHRLAHAPNPIRQPSAPAAIPAEAATPRDWTVLVYSNQFDSDLFSFHDLKMAEANVDPARVSVVYRMRRVDGADVADEFKRHHWVTWADGNWSGVRTSLVRPSDAPYFASGSPVLLEGPDADLDDTANLSEFIRWGVENFPARRYCLSLWNHGSHVKGRSLVEDCALPISVDRFGRELRDGWRASAGSGRKLDLLILNGCNLASTELLYEVSEVAQFAFATQTRHNVPGDAFLYRMLSQPEQSSTRDMLRAYFDDMVVRGQQAYARNGIDTAFAASAIDLERLRNFAGALGEVARAILDEPGRDCSGLEAMLPAEDPQFCGFEFDAGDLLRRLGQHPGRVGERARAARELYETDSRSPVMAHVHNERMAHLSGLNVYVKTPATVATVERLWREAKRLGADERFGERQAGEFAGHPYHETLFARESRWGPALLHLLGR